MAPILRTPNGKEEGPRKRQRSRSTPSSTPDKSESQPDSFDERMEAMREMFTEILTQTQGISVTITEMRNEMKGVYKDLEEIKSRLETQELTILELKEKVRLLESRKVPDEGATKQLASLIQKEDTLRRMKNVVVMGLEPILHEGRQREICMETATWLVNSRLAMNVEVKEARRLGRTRDDGSAAPLLITMGTSWEKWAVLKNCRKLAGTRISVQEDLPLELRMARRPFVPAYSVYRKRGRRLRWEGEQLLIDGKPLTTEEIKEASDEFWSTRKKNQRARNQPPENSNSDTGNGTNGSQ
jgi:hypothetical protein